MPNTVPTVRASVLAVLAEYIHAHGFDVKSLVSEADIDIGIVSHAETQIPLNRVGRLFEIVGRALGDHAFGLSYAKAFPPGTSGLLGHLILTAPTVRDVFLVLARYTHIHTTSLQPVFVMRDGVGWFNFSWPDSFSEPLIQYTAFTMGTLVLRIRRAAGSHWVPLAVEFQHRAPAKEALPAYHEMFGTRLRFDQPSNRIGVDASTLARPMPEILPKLRDNLLILGDRQLDELAPIPEDDAATRLQKLLAKRLEDGQPFDLDTVADALGLASGRSLQWRLHQEQTTYENVLLLTRLLLVERYLRDSDFQLSRVAALLGFSELSAFTRWCRRQFRMSPSAYRRQLRSNGSVSASPQNAS